MQSLPLSLKFHFAEEVQDQLRRAVLDDVPQFLFETSTSLLPPTTTYSSYKWKHWLEQVRKCMPVQNVVIDLDEKRAYDWESYFHTHHWRYHDHSQATNLWYALAARLDPWPAEPAKRFDWDRYVRLTPRNENENARYYHILAEFMPPWARVDPVLSSRGGRNPGGGRFLNGNGPMPSALTMSYVRADVVVRKRLARIGISLRLGKNLKNDCTRVHRDAASIEFDLDDDERVWVSSFAAAVIHQDGHIGAFKRIVTLQDEYDLYESRAEGLLQYMDLFEMDVNFPYFDNGQGEHVTIMTDTDLSDDPRIVIALMKYGAKPLLEDEEEGGHERTLADLARDTQSIHASTNMRALARLTEAAVHFLEIRGIIAPQAELSPADYESLREAEKHAQSLSNEAIAESLCGQLSRVAECRESHEHPNRNGKKALSLVRSFVAIKYPSEDVSLLILKALCQAAHQYGPHRQTCDPVRLVVNVLAGRVTEAEIHLARDENGSTNTASLALPRNFLEELRQLQGTKTHSIMEEGQRRLSLLRAEDQQLLPILYHKIINMDSTTYATNRLRGLFAKQILEDGVERTLDEKFREEGGLAGLSHVPPEMSQVLNEIHAIADKFTALFLSGDFMQQAFAPFLAGEESDAEDGDPAAPNANADDIAETAGDEPSAKRQKV
eukprot:g3530.t1